MPDELTSLAEQLRRVNHFKSLPLADVIQIVAAGQVRRFARSATLFAEGDPCAGMHVLLSGQVDLCKTGPEGQVSILNTLQPVIMFNEVAVLDGGPNPVSAVAVEDSLIWQVRCERFQVLLDRYPQIARGLLGVLARRNRHMLSHYSDLSFRSVTARVAKRILTLSQEGAQPVRRAEYSVVKLAAQVVTTPEAVSRALRQLAEKKVLAVNRQTILVLDKSRLQELAQIDI